MVKLCSPAARPRISVMIAIVLAACGGNNSSNGNVGSAPISNIAPAPSPSPIPTPSPTASAGVGASNGMMPFGTSVASPTLAGLAEVPSGINVANYLQRSWGTGDIPATMAPDVVGAFRFQCTPSHNAFNDPIVYPGQPGKAHLHTFFGNTGTDANSTYASLRTSGGSTCNDILNRSAYWIPAMMNGQGKVVMPNFVVIYYKRRVSTDPECQRMGTACVALPRGLRYVFGYNMSDPSQGSTHYFDCNGPGAIPGHYANIAQAARACPVGAMLGVQLASPGCWNGKELDSPDHRSHVAHASYGSWGYLKCPATHPYVLPQFTITAWYTTDATLDRSGDESATAKTWYFSSDRMSGMAPQVPGTTFHADWFGAWEDSIMNLWMNNCIDKLLSCSGGDLGNGQQIRTTNGYRYSSETVLAEIPSRPS